MGFFSVNVLNSLSHNLIYHLNLFGLGSIVVVNVNEIFFQGISIVTNGQSCILGSTKYFCLKKKHAKCYFNILTPNRKIDLGWFRSDEFMNEGNKPGVISVYFIFFFGKVEPFCTFMGRMSDMYHYRKFVW